MSSLVESATKARDTAELLRQDLRAIAVNDSDLVNYTAMEAIKELIRVIDKIEAIKRSAK